MSGFYTGSRYLGINIERGVCSDRGVCKIPMAMPSSSRFSSLFIDIVRVQQKVAKAKCHLVTWRRNTQASDHQNNTGDLSAKCSIVLGVSKCVKGEASPASTRRIYTDIRGFLNVSYVFSTSTSIYHTLHGRCI